MTHTDDQPTDDRITDDRITDDRIYRTAKTDVRTDGSVPKSATFGPDENVSEAIVSLVSRASGLGPTELTPLYEAVEPDALDALISHGRQTDNPGGHRLQFRYEGYDVIVRADGRLRLESARQ